MPSRQRSSQPPARHAGILLPCLGLGVGTYCLLLALGRDQGWIVASWCMALGLLLAFQSGARQATYLVLSGVLLAGCGVLAFPLGSVVLFSWSAVPLLFLVLPALPGLGRRGRHQDVAAA